MCRLGFRVPERLSVVQIVFNLCLVATCKLFVLGSLGAEGVSVKVFILISYAALPFAAPPAARPRGYGTQVSYGNTRQSSRLPHG
jgi:hypothetical protein